MSVQCLDIPLNGKSASPSLAMEESMIRMVRGD